MGKDGAVKMDEYKREDGSVNVCKGIRDLMENSKAEGREEGMELGAELKCKGVILKMLKKGMAIADICEIAECDVEYVEKIKEKI